MSDREEAQRRVDEACRLIESAYRLEMLDPADTLARVRAAITFGVEQQAADAIERATDVIERAHAS